MSTEAVGYIYTTTTPLSAGLQLSTRQGSVVLGTLRCAGMVVQDVHGYRDIVREESGSAACLAVSMDKTPKETTQHCSLLSAQLNA